MADPPLETSVTVAGIGADHPVVKLPPSFVAPATGAEVNTLRDPLLPRACWMVEDARFEFDSSFVLPEIETEIRILVRLRRRLPKHPLSVFAHADPVGNDDYNKTLSGRRAIAIYALLTRRVDLWDELFDRPFGNDRWGPAALQTMAEALAEPPAPEPPLTDDEKAIAFFDEAEDRGPGCLVFALQRSEDQPKETAPPPAAAAGATPADRAAAARQNPSARRLLFREYMDRLCGPDGKFEKEEFLGEGVDAGGKGDFQGCSEFNPILLFSRADAQRFQPKELHEERNEQNTPNRRVLVYLFPVGSRIDVQAWPCPRAREGPAACRKRFWSDAEVRRSNKAEQREYSKTRDTFACRFYDRLAHASPCETAPIPERVRLYDTRSNFIPHAPFRLTIPGQPVRIGRASAKGIFTVRARPGAGEGLIEWGVPPAPGEAVALPFQEKIFLSFGGDPADTALRKLQNLGYNETGAPASSRVAAFQSDYRTQFGLEVTGVLDPRTAAAIDRVHDGTPDRLREAST